MKSDQEFYSVLIKEAMEDKAPNEMEQKFSGQVDAYQLDCLLYPKKHAPVWHFGSCECLEENPPCAAACIFRAISKDKSGKISIDKALCCGCSACIDCCESGKLVSSKDILPALYALRHADGPTYALVAPAFIGQYDQRITPGMLRSALKKIGFTGMVEVSLFADILTLKEALEFDRSIQNEKDFLITSCCCPVWIAMIRRIYSQYIPHVPASVSPMIACGRTIKRLHPGAATFFIGPCVAKKAEAREADIADAVDFVLTFDEMRDIFDAFQINLTAMKEDQREHSSKAGRLYASTGGVSRAVSDTLKRLNPGRKLTVKAAQADSVPDCRNLLELLKQGRCKANFLEGMGCPGGCVGGPKAIISSESGRKNVEQYANEAKYATPADNPYALDLLQQLGLDSIERLLDESDIFTRHFD